MLRLKRIVALVIFCGAASMVSTSAFAAPIFDLSPTNNVTSRSAGDGPGQGVSVTSSITITQMAMNLYMPSGGSIKYMIWDGSNSTLLYSQTLSVSASSSLSFVLSAPFSYTLQAGQTYYFGVIANNNVSVGYISPQGSYSANGLTALTTGNSNYTNYSSPSFVGIAGAQIGLQLFGGSVVVVIPFTTAVSGAQIYPASDSILNAAAFRAMDVTLGGDSAVDGASATPRRGIWLHGISSFGSANGFTLADKGFVLGNGFSVSPDLTLGVAFSSVYTGTTSADGSVNGSLYGASAYAIYSQGRMRASAGAAIGTLDNSVTRNLASLGMQASSGNNGFYDSVGLRVAYRLGGLQYFALPFAAAEYVHTEIDGASETGAGSLNLAYSSTHADIGQLQGGVTAGLNLQSSIGAIVPWVQASALATVGQNHVATVASLGSSAVAEYATVAPRGAMTIGAGVRLTGNGCPWTVEASWNGQYGGGTTLENFGLEAQYQWGSS